MRRAKSVILFTPPMECLPVTRIPEGDTWIYELKLDGYRARAIQDRGGVRLLSGNGKDLTKKYPLKMFALPFTFPDNGASLVPVRDHICAKHVFLYRLRVHQDFPDLISARHDILVTEDGVPKLLDFGVAKMLDAQNEASPRGENTVSLLRILTPDFASPEQVRGEPITIASDVYSLGMILYLLLTGQHPYRISGTVSQQVIDTVCTVTPKRPSAVVERTERQQG